MFQHKNWFNARMFSLFFFFLKALNSCAKQTKGNCSEYCWSAAHPQAQQLRFQQDLFSCLYFQNMILDSGCLLLISAFQTQGWTSWPWGQKNIWELPSCFMLVTGRNQLGLRVGVILWQVMDFTWKFLKRTQKNFPRCVSSVTMTWKIFVETPLLTCSKHLPCDISFPVILASASHLPPFYLASCSLLLPLCSPVSSYRSCSMIQFSSWRAQNNDFCFILFSLSQHSTSWFLWLCLCCSVWEGKGREEDGEDQWTQGALPLSKLLVSRSCSCAAGLEAAAVFISFF